MPSVTMPLPRMNNPAIPATVTFNFREMPALNGPGNGEVVADDGLVVDTGEWSLWQNLEGTFISAPTAAAEAIRCQRSRNPAMRECRRCSRHFQTCTAMPFSVRWRA